MTDYLNIGKLVSAFGLNGEVILRHQLGKKSSLKGLQAIFIEEKKNAFIPWFIEATRIKSDEEIYIKLEGIDTREKAIKLVQKQVWLPEAEFKKYALKSSPVNLLGYTIIDGDNTLGNIDEVI